MAMQETNDFKIKFRGTRGSHPSPKQSHLKYGGNTSCIEVHAGGHLIILDAGTGIIDLGRDLQKEHILSGTDLYSRTPVKATLILSHLHQDHIQGLQFFSPLFIPTTTLDIYGPPYQGTTLEKALSNLLFEHTFPVAVDEIPSNFNIYDFKLRHLLIIKPDGAKEFVKASDFDIKNHADDVIISVLKTTAHPKNGSISIKIQYKNKSLVYATDKESYIGCDKKFIEFAHGTDVLIHDSQYTHQDYVSPILPKQGFGHSTFNMAAETAKYAKAKKLFFFHYDPNYDDGILDMLEKEFIKNTTENSGSELHKGAPLNILFARENLEFVI